MISRVNFKGVVIIILKNYYYNFKEIIIIQFQKNNHYS